MEKKSRWLDPEKTTAAQKGINALPSYVTKLASLFGVDKKPRTKDMPYKTKSRWEN